MTYRTAKTFQARKKDRMLPGRHLEIIRQEAEIPVEPFLAGFGEVDTIPND